MGSPRSYVRVGLKPPLHSEYKCTHPCLQLPQRLIKTLSYLGIGVNLLQESTVRTFSLGQLEPVTNKDIFSLHRDYAIFSVESEKGMAGKEPSSICSQYLPLQRQVEYTHVCNIGEMRLIPIPALTGSYWCLRFNCSDDAQSRWWAELLVLCRGLGPTAAYGTTSVWFFQDQINKEYPSTGGNGEDMAASMTGITCKCLSEFKDTNNASVRSLTCWEKHSHAALNSTFTVSKKGHSSIKNHTHFGFSLKKAQMGWPQPWLCISFKQGRGEKTILYSFTYCKDSHV